MMNGTENSKESCFHEDIINFKKLLHMTKDLLRFKEKGIKIYDEPRHGSHCRR